MGSGRGANSRVECDSENLQLSFQMLLIPTPSIQPVFPPALAQKLEKAGHSFSVWGMELVYFPLFFSPLLPSFLRAGSVLFISVSSIYISTWLKAGAETVFTKSKGSRSTGSIFIHSSNNHLLPVMSYVLHKDLGSSR